MRSTAIVSQLFENLNETTRRLEKQRRDWESTKDSYKLETERLESVKEKKCMEVSNEWQRKMEEKEEEMEALVIQLQNNQKENERTKVEKQEETEDLENETNELIVEKETLVEQLSEAGLKVDENEQELTILKEQVEREGHEIQELTEVNQKLNNSNKELKQEKRTLRY